MHDTDERSIVFSIKATGHAKKWHNKRSNNNNSTSKRRMEWKNIERDRKRKKTKRKTTENRFYHDEAVFMCVCVCVHCKHCAFHKNTQRQINCNKFYFAIRSLNLIFPFFFSMEYANQIAIETAFFEWFVFFFFLCFVIITGGAVTDISNWIALDIVIVAGCIIVKIYNKPPKVENKFRNFLRTSRSSYDAIYFKNISSSAAPITIKYIEIVKYAHFIAHLKQQQQQQWKSIQIFVHFRCHKRAAIQSSRLQSTPNWLLMTEQWLRTCDYSNKQACILFSNTTTTTTLFRETKPMCLYVFGTVQYSAKRKKTSCWMHSPSLFYICSCVVVIFFFSSLKTSV